MLARAADKHPKPAPKTALAKQLFSSSPPSADPVFLNGLHPSQTIGRQYERSVPKSSNILKPSSAAVLNGQYRPPQPGSKASSLKRSSNGDLISVDQSVSSTAFGCDNSSNCLAQLHNGGVWFDEADIENDDDLDLDVEYTLPTKIPAQPTIPTGEPSRDSVNQPLPSNGPNEPKQPPITILSSGKPVEWPSSPPEHMFAQHNSVSLQRVTQPSDDNPRPAKARNLPWTAGEIDTVEPPSMNASGKKDPASRPKNPYASYPTNNNKRNIKTLQTAKTKIPMQDDLKYPWNTTAPAVKEDFIRKKKAGTLPSSKNPSLNTNDDSTTVPKRSKKISPLFLSEEQKRVLKLAVENAKSVFFTGSAGTGKSVLMREIIAGLRKKYYREPDRVAVTASTGLAACNIGGVTIHSFAGIGLGKESVPELVRKIKKNAKAKQRWLRTKALIVDEISMVDGDLFDKLEGIARDIRNNGRPFGGIQLIITGDFFQLPPVPEYGKMAKFAFEAGTWNTSIEHTIGLTQVFRQKDPTFADMLNEMRLGRLTAESIEIFKSLSRPIEYGDGMTATELFPTRNEVERSNHQKMQVLDGTGIPFVARDAGSIKEKLHRDKLLANCMAPAVIELKPGAQVMLIKNIDETLVNGSLGKVVRFMDEKSFEFYHQDEDDDEAATQTNSEEESTSNSKRLLRGMISNEPTGDTSNKYPLVRFIMLDGTSRDLLCQPETWKIELPNGEVQASRTQIPLILAWALSIHKAQGQTLERVKVNLGKVFEKGQAYVALSRATCKQGLQVLNFDARKVMAHEKVKSFYDSLYSANTTRSNAKRQPVSRGLYDSRNHDTGLESDQDEDYAGY